MKAITLADYWKGRDRTAAAELTAEMVENAKLTVERVNALLTLFYRDNAAAAIRTVNSGWRPAAVNARVHHAAKGSRHLTAQACDLSDDDGQLDGWLMSERGQQALTACALWMEHPAATPRWSHVQTVPPRSGRRVFYP